MSILSGDLASLLTDALTEFEIPQCSTIQRKTLTGPNYDPIVTMVDHPCNGWVDTYSTSERLAGDVLVNDRKVFVVASSLDIAPTITDGIVIGGIKFTIIKVQIDPAGACWVIQCRE